MTAERPTLVPTGVEPIDRAIGGLEPGRAHVLYGEPETGKTKVRLVNINSEGFRVARAYMIRLEAEDFAHAAWVDRLADAARLSPGAFRQRFEYLAGGR